MVLGKGPTPLPSDADTLDLLATTETAQTVILKRMFWALCGAILLFILAAFQTGRYLTGIETAVQDNGEKIEAFDRFVKGDVIGRINRIETKVDRDILPEAELRLDVVERQLSEISSAVRVLEHEVGLGR